jgi:energy-converting hydrogenase Eha subunit E
VKSIHFGYLFLGLTAALIAESVAATWAPESEWIVQGALTLLLVVGVWSLHERRAAFYAGLALAVLGIATSIGHALTATPAAQALNLAVIGGFSVITVSIATRQVLTTSGPVDLDRLMGSLCIYLLLGILWAVYYALLEMADPGAFHHVLPAGANLPSSHFLYYSFVTLTTLGYGDVVPLSPLVRTGAYLEAVIGQIYLTVLVASLVGRHVSAWSDPEPSI